MDGIRHFFDGPSVFIRPDPTFFWGVLLPIGMLGGIGVVQSEMRLFMEHPLKMCRPVS